LDEEDRFATPLRLAAQSPDTLPGVVVHAYQIAQLLDGRETRRTPPPLTIALTVIMAALGIVAGALFIDWGLLTAAIGAAALVHLLAAFVLFIGSSVLVPVVAPVFALMFGGAGGAALSARRNASGRRALDQAFRHYLAPEIVDEIMRRPEQFKIDGEEREISILVTDIEGFTAMLGEGETRVLAEAFNDYFDALIDVVIAHGGAVDKIVGDGLFAMFGAPVRQGDHAARAVRCALAIDVVGQAFRKQRADIGFGRTRIGVSSGRALVGSFGGARRINYTAYGPVVNLADRLQAANKVIGTRILISAATLTLAGEVAARPVGALALRGMPGLETVHEPCETAPSADYLEAYSAMAASSDKARALFEGLSRADPGDALAAFHKTRLERGQSGVEIDLRAP
jgi:adenylate cyclase